MISNSESHTFLHDLAQNATKELAADPLELFRATIAHQIKLMHKYTQLIKLSDNLTTVR